MGLDQYAFARKTNNTAKFDHRPDYFDPANSNFDIKIAERDAISGNEPLLAFWRKYWNLDCYMAELYVAKGGKPETWGYAILALDIKDIDAFEKALPDIHTDGFYDPDYDPDYDSVDEDEMDEDAKFIAAARKYLSDGWAIYYVRGN